MRLYTRCTIGIRRSISTGTSLEFFVVNLRLGFWGKFLGRFIRDYSLIVYTCPLLWLVTSACKTLMFQVAVQNHIVMSIKLMVVPQLMLFESCKVQCFHLTGKVEFWMTLSWFEDFLKWTSLWHPHNKVKTVDCWFLCFVILCSVSAILDWIEVGPIVPVNA